MQMPTDGTTLQLVFLVSGEHLGRRRLARRTGLSEMTVRLGLERLRDAGFLTLGKSGATLTDSGKERFAPLLSHVKRVCEIALHSLAQDAVTLAALLSSPATRPPWWYRDHAVREGASAMLLIRCCVEGLYFSHSKERIGTHNPHDEQVIKGAFPFRREGDLLIIVTAPDRKRAGLGLWRDRKRAGLGLWRVIDEMLCEAP
jgi:predicted transcriptional regulator